MERTYQNKISVALHIAMRESKSNLKNLYLKGYLTTEEYANDSLSTGTAYASMIVQLAKRGLLRDEQIERHERYVDSIIFRY